MGESVEEIQRHIASAHRLPLEKAKHTLDLADGAQRLIYVADHLLADLRPRLDPSLLEEVAALLTELRTCLGRSQWEQVQELMSRLNRLLSGLFLEIETAPRPKPQPPRAAEELPQKQISNVTPLAGFHILWEIEGGMGKVFIVSREGQRYAVKTLRDLRLTMRFYTLTILDGELYCAYIFLFFWSFTVKLTRRQETFIHKMLDLYREFNGPIHYSVLAKQLGVSRFTAYDMLRLLEEKGLVTSEYQVASDRPGPGRSEVFFLPTERAGRLFAELAGDVSGVDWEAVKERVLEKVRSGEVRDRELAEEMLARIPPEGEGVLRYCVEVMTIIALRLRRSAGRRLLMEYLPLFLSGGQTASRASLSLLGGFALGLLANENASDREWSRELFAHVQRYQSLVAEMDTKLCRRLASSLNDVFAPLSRPS